MVFFGENAGLFALYVMCFIPCGFVQPASFLKLKRQTHTGTEITTLGQPTESGIGGGQESNLDSINADIPLKTIIPHHPIVKTVVPKDKLLPEPEDNLLPNPSTHTKIQLVKVRATPKTRETPHTIKMLPDPNQRSVSFLSHRKHSDKRPAGASSITNIIRSAEATRQTVSALGPVFRDLGPSLADLVSLISDKSGVFPPPGIIFGTGLSYEPVSSFAVDLNPVETTFFNTDTDGSLGAAQLPFPVHLSDRLLEPNIVTSQSPSSSSANAETSITPNSNLGPINQGTPLSSGSDTEHPVIQKQATQWFWPGGHNTGPLPVALGLSPRG